MIKTLYNGSSSDNLYLQATKIPQEYTITNFLQQKQELEHLTLYIRGKPGYPISLKWKLVNEITITIYDFPIKQKDLLPKSTLKEITNTTDYHVQSKGSILTVTLARLILHQNTSLHIYYSQRSMLQSIKSLNTNNISDLDIDVWDCHQQILTVGLCIWRITNLSPSGFIQLSFQGIQYEGIYYDDPDTDHDDCQYFGVAVFDVISQNSFITR
jgi:hypothetical protein